MTPLGPRDPDRAGPYELLGRLGSGGQGVVYLGRDHLGGLAAVKMLNLDLHHNPRAKRQFVKEIDAARRVSPFCTAQILFADVDSDPPYVASEYIEGPSLQRHVDEHGPITGNALHRLAVGTATALAAIHQADVVHCDLKPDNVVLGADGPRVIDFGIARALDATETMTSRIMGTAPYMAPERFRDEEIGPASDVFAWAATIAFAATGRPPFGTGAVVAVMMRVLHDPPDVAGLPGPLAELVGRCLDKDHRARPPAPEILLRLLGHAPQAGVPVPIQTALRAGTDAAADHPVAHRPTPPAPAARPVAHRPGSPAPTRAGEEPGTARDTWPRRLRREYADPWGVSAAIFLGAVGGAAGYVASTAVGTAAAVGAVTFVVVYGVRLVVATALPGRAAAPRPAPAEPASRRGGPPVRPGA
jgi:serine/threonine protein kinase